MNGIAINEFAQMHNTTAWFVRKAIKSGQLNTYKDFSETKHRSRRLGYVEKVVMDEKAQSYNSIKEPKVIYPKLKNNELRSDRFKDQPAYQWLNNIVAKAICDSPNIQMEAVE